MAPRIPIAKIGQLQRTLESKPECHIEEVTKVEAIRMLSAQIHAMRSKGYGLRAIAAVLSENGVAVTAVTLKGYLKKFKSAGGRKSARKRGNRRGRDDSQTNTLVDVSASSEGAHDDVAPSSPKAGREGAAGGARGGIFGGSQREELGSNSWRSG